MLAQGVEIPYAYASFDDEFRDIILIRPPKPTDTGVWNAALSLRQEQPNGCIIARCQSGIHAGKVVYLSGIPDADTIYPPLAPPAMAGPFLGAFEAWVIALIQGGWGWKGVSYDPTISPITNVGAVISLGTTWVATVASSAGFRPGLKAKFSKGKWLGPTQPNPNRVYLIKAVPDATTVVLNWGDNTFAANSYVGEGKLQVQNTVIYPVTAVEGDKLGTHKRGVGGDPPHGRRKVPRSR